ncbi:flagellin [Aliivibrio sp. S4TY2]|uniref:flagellin n=1 Tax=unclassified Aliivibrio TaxID=2645654 RepID=UPI002378250D|nr:MULTISPECIES: flagellin [unclassified Aliivibrio]MDD9155018.1 flagellin [Aliivibrio sp. S4TY2]MDD9158619.1 flagellin [Aliivibrio sp. S4TY1]MDD9163021.1 flagellin [Aliivibrio sp. S4MY2]MDD9166618.1 flagellin [Aliivibrio sp. S4MY4]MDD9184098.1 flagellin [Aliivibrio sp. S4MY3]
MSISVNTNISAMTAQRYMNNATAAQTDSMEKLSSGSKINSAADDASGLQISNRMTAQTRGLDVAVRNANEGMSIAQTAEGAMKETTNVLQRLRDLSLQSANGSNTDADRKAMQEEASSLTDELNRIAETTSFAGTRLINGEFGTKSFQIGADSGEAVAMTLNSMRADEATMGGKSYFAEEGRDINWKVGSENTQFNVTYNDKNGNPQEINISAKAGDDIEELATYINGQTNELSASVTEDGVLQVFMSGETISSPLEFNGSLANELKMGGESDDTVASMDLTTVGGAQRSIDVIDAALEYVDGNRASLGAFQNRFESAVKNLTNINENITDSNSQIKDTDFAKETTNLTKTQILSQSSSSILAQAKQAPSMAMSLLG